MKLSELDKFKDDARAGDRARQAYSNHTEVIRGILFTAEEEIGKYLWATNGGAAVALLAFMGANQSFRNALPAHYALLAFVVGLIALGLLRALSFHAADSTFQNWIEQVNRAQRDETEHDAPFLWIQRRSTSGWSRATRIVLGYLSFVSFIVGFVFAAYGATHS
jgi:hypothetical protein